MKQMSWKPIDLIVADIKSGTSSAAELVETSLELLDQYDSYQIAIQSCRNRAMARAKSIDVSIKNGEQVGRLAGVPFIVKDNFLTLEGQTTAASNMLRNFEAPYQATAVERLEAEGAICVAKANLDAFGHGSSTENSDWFTTKNPYDKTRVPGGSSGGSAAAVALAIAPFALGTDTGGSIRQPAAYCGIVGYKPTYGLVSRNGVVAMASSTDVIGPMTASVADAGLVLDCMAGPDEWDGTTIARDEQAYSRLDGSLVKGSRIGIVKEYMNTDVTPAVRSSVENVCRLAKEAGATVEEISIPSLSYSLGCYYIICPAEISSNLSRYDGQRYGFTAADAKTLEESYVSSRSNGFGPEAKRRIMVGTYVLSSGYYDAYYKRAQQVRTKMINEFREAFQSVDFLVSPTASSVAFKIGDRAKDPLRLYASDMMTVAANLTGIPAISIPGKSEGQLPVGIQFMAPQGRDKDLLIIAKDIEEALV